MKTIICLILAGFTAAALGQDAFERRGLSMSSPAKSIPVAPVKAYPMRSIPTDDPRFKAVLEAVVAEVAKAEARGNQSKVIRILQTVAPGEFLVKTHGDSSKHMVAAGMAFADGSAVYGTLKPRKELFSYTSVLGAQSTVRSFDFESVERIELTPENFVSLLKGGLKIEIEKGTSTIGCKDCNGWGKVAEVTPRRTSPDGKVQCALCGGKGRFIVPQRVSIQW